MFNINSKCFSIFNKKPLASWVTYMTRDFLTCYSCSYYSFMVEIISTCETTSLWIHLGVLHLTVMMERNHLRKFKVNLLLQQQVKVMTMLFSCANKSKTNRWADTEFGPFVVQTWCRNPNFKQSRYRWQTL